MNERDRLKKDLQKLFQQKKVINFRLITTEDSSGFVLVVVDSNLFESGRAYEVFEDYISFVISWLYLEYDFSISRVYQNMSYQKGILTVDQTVYVLGKEN